MQDIVHERYSQYSRGMLRPTASTIVVLLVLIRSPWSTKGDGSNPQARHRESSPNGELRVDNPSQHWNEAESIAHLEMTICDGFCTGDCVSYVTPMAVCFSPQWLFPEDPLWGEGDILDVIYSDAEGQAANSSFSRTIFESTNGTCRTSTDNFRVPLDVCVGPFDKPRPWGTFQLKTDSPIKSISVLRGRDRSNPIPLDWAQ
jgi:hypothetical protein